MDSSTANSTSGPLHNAYSFIFSDIVISFLPTTSNPQPIPGFFNSTDLSQLFFTAIFQWCQPHNVTCHSFDFSLQICSTHRNTQHMSSRCVGTLAGLSMPGVSDFIQARNALIRRFLSSTALPNQSFLRLGQVHSRKARAETNSGVWGDFPLYADHSLTITG